MFSSDETHASSCVSSSVVNSEAVNYFLSSPLAWCYSDSFIDLGMERLWNRGAFGIISLHQSIRDFLVRVERLAVHPTSVSVLEEGLWQQTQMKCPY